MTATVETVSEAVETAEVKPRRPHRRTRPLDDGDVAEVQAEEVTPEPEPTAEVRIPPRLAAIAESRRQTAQARLQREVDRIERETASRTLQLRMNGAPQAEVDRVAAQLAQSRDGKAEEIKALAAMRPADLVVLLVPESGWRP